MKNLILYSFVFVMFFTFTAVSVEAKQVEDLMQKANILYQKQEFQKAENIYQSLVDSGYSGVSLFYNLGNAYYREGKLGFAILNYERALKLFPGDDDIKHNLALAYSKTVDRIESLPEFFLYEWWESLLAFFSLDGWTYAAYIFYLLSLIFAGVYFFGRKTIYQKYSFFAAAALLILLILSVILLSIKLNSEVNIKNGIIVETTAIVKVSPDKESSDAFVIHEGLKVRLEDKIDEWMKIKLNDGKVGWLKKNNLRVI